MEKITPDNLGKWVRNRFGTPRGDVKRPIAVKYYGSKKEYDDRQVDFLKKANEKSISDLELIIKGLPVQLEEMKTKIYKQACGVLKATRSEKDNDTYKLAKDRIICWLLGSTAKPFGESFMGLMIKPLKFEYFGIKVKQTSAGIEVKPDDIPLQQAIATLNTLRKDHIFKVEKLHSARYAFHQKINDQPLEYFSNKKGEDYKKLNKHGKLEIYSVPLWSSEKSNQIDESVKDDLITDEVKQAINTVAQKISNSRNSKHAYQTIVDALTMFKKQGMKGKDVSKNFEVPPNTFSNWKTQLDEELE